VAAPGYEFTHLAGLLDSVDGPWAANLVNEILEDLLAAEVDNEACYFREVDLCAAGDFHLTLTETGTKPPGPRLAASEFDMLVTNLADVALTVPVYRTDIDPERVERRPGALVFDEVVVAPHGTACFAAYLDIADIGLAAQNVPVLVVHSSPRGVMTWVFERETLEPATLTTTHLQASRLQLAIRVMGELGAGAREVESLEALAASEYLHFVRWEAAQAVYMLDPSRGIRLLEDHLTADRHAGVRKAASASLERLLSAAG
jgi:hypothetical protein